MRSERNTGEQRGPLSCMGEASCIPHGEIGEKQVSPAAANESTEQSRRLEPQIQSLNEGQSDDSISNTATRRRSSLTAFTSARNQTALGREGEPLEGEKSGRADSLSGTQQQQGSWKATKQGEGRVEEPGEVRQYSMQSESMVEERSPLRRPKYYLTPFSISN